MSAAPPRARERPRRLVVLAHPAGHVRSPRLHNAALARAHIPLVYEALDVPPGDLPATLRSLVAERAAGNVTIPHKRAVAAACRRLTPLAGRTGAVNTFWVEDGALVGHNTDVEGFDRAVAALLGREPGAERVTVVGAGGAAAAVLAAIERWGGARASLYNRTVTAAETLAARFAAVTTAAPTLDAALRGATLVVNATSVGQGSEALPVAVERLPAGAAVLDLVYGPDETAWVRAARAAGHAAADGTTMLVEQAAAAFECWFDRTPDRAAMWAAFR